MSGYFFRIFSVLALLFSFVAFGEPLERQQKQKLDSLEVRLQEINNPNDSIVVLYNIFDLSPTRSARSAALHRAYLAAKHQKREKDQLDILIHLSRLYKDNDDVLDKIAEEIRTLPDSDRRRENLLYVKMLKSENFINGESRETQIRHLNEIVQRFTNNPPEDVYEQAELLFALCIAMGKSTQGELLEDYMNKLQTLVESMNLGTGSVRNLVYSRAAPIFTRNRLYGDAINIDKKLLNVIDSIATSYVGQGRPNRPLNTNRYEVCRRMLINYRGLTEEEVAYFYNAIKELAAADPEVARKVKEMEVSEIFYHMARKEYAAALPILKRQLDNSELQSMRAVLLSEMAIAAEAVGDIHAQLKASTELNKIYEDKLDGRSSERYRELQILYDYNDIRKESAEKELQAKEDNLRVNRIFLAIVGAVCLLLLISVFLMLRQYRRLKHLAAEHFKTTVTLRAERNDLKRVQEELIQARDKACESDKLKTEFTNMMSHEVKAPLAAVQEYSRLIVDCIPAGQKKYLDRFAYIIEQNVKALNRLVSDVLDMSSFEFGTMTLTKSVESIHNICQVAIDSVFSNGKTTSEQVKVVFNSRNNPDVNIVTDQVRVTQVLMNLLSNADKFTEKGTISLEYEVGESHIRFIVSDTGIGIPDNCEEIIFERYRKLSPLSRGLGLGLYISRKIAILLRGDVRVDTDYHGGSRFVFTLMREDWTPEEK